MLTFRRFSLLALVSIIAAVGSVAAESKGGIPADWVEALLRKDMDGGDRTIADILANKNIKDIALNRERFIDHNKFVNHKIETGDVTNQKSSGRCWMFAGFNVLRPQVMKKFDLESFEFSQNYLFFWDKMEKTNKFLQNMIDFADRPLDDRELEIVIDNPLGDGGWWTYFTDLIEKYGVVPKEIMPETENSSSTGMMNKLISLKVSEMGLALRNMAREGKPDDELENKKREMLAEIYRFLVLNLGRPPTEFTWRYETKDSTSTVTHINKYSPKSFYKEAIDVDLSECVALFDYPGKDYYENYSLRLSRNIYDRPNFTIMNLPVDTLKAYALKSVLDSTPVWFACDVGKENYGDKGIMALDIYNYESIYGTKFDMPKADLIHMQKISPNHAMTFIGVDTTGLRANKWLVENSWGDKRGDDGMWYMYNDWFDRYVFGVIIHTRYLSDDLRKLAERKPTELPPWDPMYALNRLR